MCWTTELLPDGCCLSLVETNPLRYLLEHPCCRYGGDYKQEGGFASFPHGFCRVRNPEFKIHWMEGL